MTLTKLSATTGATNTEDVFSALLSSGHTQFLHLVLKIFGLRQMCE